MDLGWSAGVQLPSHAVVVEKKRKAPTGSVYLRALLNLFRAVYTMLDVIPAALLVRRHEARARQDRAERLQHRVQRQKRVGSVHPDRSSRHVRAVGRILAQVPLVAAVSYTHLTLPTICSV
eukprot:3184774-Rhodomonas_salina.1